MPTNRKSMAEIIQCYQGKAQAKTFKPENYLDIPRVLGEEFAIDMNRLVCQHQQHVASAYMRRIRKKKIQQRDVYFQGLQTIPMKIKRMAVGPDYTDPYSNLKKRFHKLGYDNKIKKTETPPYPHMEGSRYVPHNSLAPHMTLFKMNPTGANNVSQTGKPVKTGRVEDDLPFPSPRRTKVTKPSMDDTPRKRFSVDMSTASTKVKDVSVSGSEDNTPRCPTNSPRSKNAFWNFSVPRELNKNTNNNKTHVSSIPRGKNILAAISSVQKHNKPLPPIAVKA